jgi:hypothetical protein
MARNRVIYQSEGLYVSTDASLGAVTDAAQLTRVQSANYSYTINRQDVNQYGELARIDSLVLEPPTVTVDFSYYLTDGLNERILEFYVQTGGGSTEGNFASGHLTAGSGVNVYVITSPESDDLNTSAGGSAGLIGASDRVLGIGNCYLTDYSIDLSVGALPTASVTMEGANMQSSDGDSIDNPAVDQEAGTSVGTTVVLPGPEASGTGQTLSALRPGDITMDFGAFDADTFSDLAAADSIHIQSATISVPLARTPLDRLGSKFAYARTVDFPVVSTLSVSAIMNEQQEKNLSTLLEEGENDITITMKYPGGAITNPAIRWGFKGALVDSESWSSSIGSNKAVDITFSTQIGGPEDIDDGVFMSGINNDWPYQTT